MYEKWKPIYTALACDVMDQMGYRHQAMEHHIRPSQPDSWLAGPATTLDVWADPTPSDDPYGMVFEAYNQVEKGNVIVIATNGEHQSGMWGELLSTAAQAQGVNAVVTDGLVRDIRLMDQMNFSCFCRGYTPLDSAGRSLAKAVNTPVQCGGITVQPGDFVLADFEGVAVIPADIVEAVYQKSMEKLEGENTVRQELADGHSPREVFDKYGIL